MQTDPDLSTTTQPRRAWRLWIYDLLLVLVLLAGAYFRFAGLNWGEYTYLHPDERFLIWVGTDISPVKSLSEYFDAARSSLNPVNVGHSFYVYGTLPMFITRYVVQEIYGHSGFNEMTDVGRFLSAAVDMLTLLLVYLIADRAYNKRIALLATAFSACAVLQIQQSHFFTMDTFITFFMTLAAYFAVRVGFQKWEEWTADGRRLTAEGVQPSPPTPPLRLVPILGEGSSDEASPFSLEERRGLQNLQLRDEGEAAGDQPSPPAPLPIQGEGSSEAATDEREAVGGRSSAVVIDFLRHPLFLLSLGFGIALGCAAASKINAAPAAILLPAAMLIRILPLKSEERYRQAAIAIPYLVMAAAISLLVFRVFQPYAFSGPGFFGLKLDPRWLANMREAQQGSMGDPDYPFALQWARRSIFFSGKNLVLWGLGLPLGVLAFAGVAWMGWRILKGEWKQHILLWGWFVFYFAWQSSLSNPTMRYQLPNYPLLAIFAAWAVVTLYDRGSQLAASGRRPSFVRFRLPAILVGALVLALTAGWAFAFTRIYANPITRVAATRWIYQNIPGPINLHIQTATGLYNQPVYYPTGFTIEPGRPFTTSFVSETDGFLSQVNLGSMVDQTGQKQMASLKLSISTQPGGQPAATGQGTLDLSSSRNAAIALSQPIPVNFQARYYLTVESLDQARLIAIDGPLTAQITTSDGQQINQQLPYPVQPVSSGQPFSAAFQANVTGLVNEIYLSNAVDPSFSPASKTLTFEITNPAVNETLATGTLQGALAPASNSQEQSYTVKLDRPVHFNKGETFGVRITLSAGSGAVTLEGAGIANESDFDDALPLRLDGYDAIYPRGLSFQMYWDENPDKLDRFLNMMQQSDYILFTSSRQWGSLPRTPERYPMSTIYYRDLLGCPPSKDVVWCYEVAQPGMFHGSLGYDLVKVFESDPSIGPVHINDQSAEEAFTVYDHPKVFIFKKNASFNAQADRALLGAVDFSKVIRLTPLKFPSHPADLMLPLPRLVQQRLGGAWSQYFNPAALYNRFEFLGVVVWYLAVFLLGLAVYPLVRVALSGLPDRGYPLTRIAGMLILSYVVWMAGSLQVPASRLNITFVLLAMVVVGLLLAYWQRDELRQEWRTRKRYFLMIEGLALAFFLFDLLIRYGNPDLWHQWKGGEKPMDFAYFNAVLKSTSFPPYDPWFAGGYLNYYYYGFVLVGVLTKWLGIVPSFAYNLILPSVFMMIALGAFSVAWNLFVKEKGDRETGRPGENGDSSAQAGIDHPSAEPGDQRSAIGEQRSGDSQAVAVGGQPSAVVSLEATHQPSAFSLHPFFAGLAGALFMAVLGNLGTIRMIFQGYERLAAPGGVIDNANLLTRWIWAAQGFVAVVMGKSLPYGIADWYWNPSRVMTSNDLAITEFPFFTVVYGDPHAHLFAMPVALLALAFAVSMVLGRARWKGWLEAAITFLLGGLAIGALYPINLSDIYSYLPLGLAATGYVLWLYLDITRIKILDFLPALLKRLVITAAGLLILFALARLMFRPYEQWYGQAYSSVELWKGIRTPSGSYLTHWGLFLFVFITWMAWETIDWMAKTPLSALRKLQPYREIILGALLVFVLAIAALTFSGIYIAWIVLPLAAWAGLLLFRPGMPDPKRAVLFLIGTGLVITLMVEIIVVKGDIGRMNTVFKFYLQTWALFAVSAAAAVGWMLTALPTWRFRMRLAWQLPFTALVISAALFTLLGGMAKMKDRMVPGAPHTLDGMTYMNYATYEENGVNMDLSQDYNAIRWMQENVPGSPVIVEANSGDLYRWFARFSIYTGLPDVVGWQWHQQQQRAMLPFDWVTERLNEVNNFYLTTDAGVARDFLKKFDVQYVIFGQLEKAHYPGPGLNKFPALEGVLWRTVYQDKDTTIYQVIQ